MAAGDTLASLGEKVTEVFVNAFASSNPSVSLVFLPFALPVPDDIVQGGVVNPTRMTAFLVPNFDAPYLMSASQYTVHGRDIYYGAASQIYATAVTLAQPASAVGSPAWKRVTSEIAMAQAVLNPSGVSVSMMCVPDDWVSPGSTGYWSTFDSTQSQGAPAQGIVASPAPGSGAAPPQTPRAISPMLWSIKPAAAQATPAATLNYIHEVRPSLVERSVASPMMTARPMTPMAVARPAASAAAAREIAPAATVSEIRRVDTSELSIHATLREPGVSTVWRRPPWPRQGRPPPPPPPPPSSSMAVHFEYMSVTIGFMAAGISVWNGVFLADANWCVSGMAKGGLLPAPDTALQEGHGPLAYGLPIALIVVRNLTISVKWSGQDRASLGNSGGFLGPFSLAGATAAAAPDGSWVYSQSGMQVVALLCNHLPVLPPQDGPDLVAQASPGTASGSPSRPPPAQNSPTGASLSSPPPVQAGASPTSSSPSPSAGADPSAPDAGSKPPSDS